MNANLKSICELRDKKSAIQVEISDLEHELRAIDDEKDRFVSND